MIVLQHEDLWTNLQGGHIGVLQVDSRDNGGGGGGGGGSMNVITAVCTIFALCQLQTWDI